MSVTATFVASVLALDRVLIGLTFAFSAVGKLRDITAFRQAIASFDLIPRRWSKAVAIGLAAAESTVTILVAAGGPALRPGFLMAGALLLVFSVALTVALRRGVRAACSCFGPTERPMSPYDLARNVILVGCTLVGVLILSAPRRDLAVLDVALLVVAGSCFAVLLNSLADVVPTLRRPFTPLHG